MLFLLFLITFCLADTGIQDSASLQEFAYAARPYWKLSQAEGQHDTCWPSYCTENNKVVGVADLDVFPDASSGCPEAGSAFPIYWNGRKCSDDEIRIGYNLFYKKDGFEFLGTSIFGHHYDWERVVVIFNKNADGNWYRTKALYSQHEGYENYRWNEIQTSNEDNLDELSQGKDHPTVFIGWAKHSNFKDLQTFSLSTLDEFTLLAYRNDHYKYYNTEEQMIEVVSGTDIWNAINEYKGWGSAKSTPPLVFDQLCGAS